LTRYIDAGIRLSCHTKEKKTPKKELHNESDLPTRYKLTRPQSHKRKLNTIMASNGEMDNLGNDIAGEEGAVVAEHKDKFGMTSQTLNLSPVRQASSPNPTTTSRPFPKS